MAPHHLLVRVYLLLSRFWRGMTLGVRAAVFDGEGRIFLVKHSYMPGWYLPGGGVSRGETMEAAMARELKEEGGIVVEGPTELFGLYLNTVVSARDHVALYICRVWSQPAPPKLPNMEIVDCGFHAIDALPKDTTPGTRRRIAEIVEGVPRSAEW